MKQVKFIDEINIMSIFPNNIIYIIHKGLYIIITRKFQTTKSQGMKFIIGNHETKLLRTQKLFESL